MLPESVKTSRAKVLYVHRDARDVCVSFYHFSRMLNIYKYRGSFADFRENFMRGKILHSPYREHVQGYLEHSDTVLCLTYEQMHQDRGSVVRKVADFLGVSLSDADVDDIAKNTSFEVMKANPDTNFRQWEDNGLVSGTEEGTFMRKGVVGDWRNYFTEEESEAFLKWRNEEFAPLN
ncbi:Amine sulfotransferase [Amphibalanus amphitrite]|uniref:Amine sulfotransferase n=1 Tax=Amphibalanus amphitrite TaxID=1232801 RepID=A0A6A4WWC7_AMPAM|nr:Amine sulfotransferase [Amphibalanus amphitrite]